MDLKTVRMRHESGVVKEAKVGFSWTTFFFGLFVPLIRGDLKWTAIMFLLTVLAGAITIPIAGIGATIVGIVFATVYNKLYIKELLLKGFKPLDADSEQALNRAGII